MPLLHQFYMHDALQLYYHLYLPVNYSRERPIPLLLVLHSEDTDANGMLRLTQNGFNQLADEYNFMVCYPDGISRVNGGNFQGNLRQNRGGLDVIQGMLDSLTGFYAIDRQRIFVAGMSNGGYMAYQMACDLPERFAGIAAVAALLPADLMPRQPVPTLIIAGTDDPIMPYKGGVVQSRLLQRSVVRSAMETLRIWAEANRCGGEPSTELLDDVDPRDRMSVQQTMYRDCAASVMLYTVIGGGHTWPGGKPYLKEEMVGKTSRDIDANRVIWEFFRGLTHE